MISPASAGQPALVPTKVPTKVVAPQLRSDHVARPDLTARLAEPGAARVCLVAGPAGFGKTAVLAEWAAEADHLVTWLRVDRRDCAPGWLAADLAWSIEAATPELHVDGAAEGPTDETLRRLSRAVGRLDMVVATVIDDWHVAAGDESGALLERLCEHAPPNWRFVIASRDPRDVPGRPHQAVAPAALRFGDEEARRLLRGRFGIAVGRAAAADLNRRVGGWAAAICLAGAAAGTGDPETALRRWDGTHRHLREYLTAEVLAGLDDDSVACLLDCVLLSPCRAELCDATTGRRDSARRLTEFEAAGLFLHRDIRRPGVYRCAPAVAAALRLEARQRDEPRCRQLLERAARWSAAHGDPATAIEHYLAGGRPDAAASLVGHHGYELIDRGRSGDVLRWLGAVPADRIRAHPEFHLLGLHAAWLVGDLDAQGAHLAAARRAALRVGGDRAAGISRAVAVAVAIELARRGLTEDALALAESTVTTPGEQPVGAVPHFGVDTGRVLGVLASLALWAGALDLAAGHAVAALSAGVDRHGRLNLLGVRAIAAWLGGDAAGAGTLAREAATLLAEFPRPPVQARWAAVALAWTGTDEEAEWALGVLRATPTGDRWWLGEAQLAVTFAEVQLRRGVLAEADRFLDRAARCVAGVDQPGVAAAVVAAQQRRIDGGRVTAEPDAITERERVVLELLASQLSRREIGGELDVSLNTVKTHLRQLYRKLGAASRREAVERGRALGLL